MTDIVEIPETLPLNPFPHVDTPEESYNQSAYEVGLQLPPAIARAREIAEAARTNALAAKEQAQAASGYIGQIEGIKQSALTETGEIRDQAIAARDDAALSAVAAQGLANYVGRWLELTGSLTKGVTVWHAGHYWGLLDDIADVTAAEPGVSAAWAVVGAQVHRLSYDQRDQLRTLGYPGLQWALVEGLGLFAFEAGSTEPDDDESCFVTSEGAWLLQCPSLEAVAHWLQPWLLNAQERLDDLEAVAPVLRGTGTSSITSIAAGAQVSFTVAITGATVGRTVAASPLGTLPAQVCVFAKVTAADTVTVYLNNPSTAAATLVAGSWAIAVI